MNAFYSCPPTDDRVSDPVLALAFVRENFCVIVVDVLFYTQCPVQIPGIFLVLKATLANQEGSQALNNWMLFLLFATFLSFFVAF